VGDDEGAHDGETESGSAAIGTGLGTLELFEDATACFGRDARAVIGDAQLDLVVTAGARSDHDLRARRCESQCVLQQVEQDLLGHRDVERHGRQVFVDVEPDPVSPRDRTQPAHGVLHEIGDVDVIASAVERGLTAVNLVMIRGGRHVGDRTFFPQHAEGATLDEVVPSLRERQSPLLLAVDVEPD